MTESNIFFLDHGEEPTARITQLYPHLELFSDGEPIYNTLFVQSEDLQRLLLIDPPADTMQRFQLDGDVAALFSSAPLDAGLPQVQTQPGGVAHIRIGDHYLDLYSQQHSTAIHFPTLGLLYGSDFGSDVMLPIIADGSNGHDELDMLRTLASILKRKHFQLYVPKYGASESDRIEVMKRLAADVAYLNGLRRLVSEGRERDDAVETIEIACRGLLPAERSESASQEQHDINVERLVQAADV